MVPLRAIPAPSKAIVAGSVRIAIDRLRRGNRLVVKMLLTGVFPKLHAVPKHVPVHRRKKRSVAHDRIVEILSISKSRHTQANHRAPHAFRPAAYYRLPPLES